MTVIMPPRMAMAVLSTAIRRLRQAAFQKRAHHLVQPRPRYTCPHGDAMLGEDFKRPLANTADNNGSDALRPQQRLGTAPDNSPSAPNPARFAARSATDIGLSTVSFRLTPRPRCRTTRSNRVAASKTGDTRFCQMGMAMVTQPQGQQACQALRLPAGQASCDPPAWPPQTFPSTAAGSKCLILPLFIEPSASTRNRACDTTGLQFVRSGVLLPPRHKGATHPTFPTTNFYRICDESWC